MRECFSQLAADVVDKIERCEKLSNREIAWVERALTLDYARELLLDEALGLESTNVFGLRMQPRQNSKSETIEGFHKL